MMRKVFAYAVVLAVVTALPAMAADKSKYHGMMMQHGATEQGEMMKVSSSTGASGQGILNSVDAENSVVNLTHGPIPALNWPEMTMDLPVASGVELTDLKPGDEVRFRVVLGADQVYRITAINALP